MKAARFDYVRPDDLQQAVAALGRAGGGAKLLAGGQSLGPMLNLRLARPSLLVDVSRVDSLARVEDIGRAWRIGACVTHSRIEDMREQLAGGEMLCEVAAGIAYRAIRNRGTIGGSIATDRPRIGLGACSAGRGQHQGAGGARRRSKIRAGRFHQRCARMKSSRSVQCQLSRGRYGYYKFCARPRICRSERGDVLIQDRTPHLFRRVCRPVAPALAGGSPEGRSLSQSSSAASPRWRTSIRERRMVTAAVTRAQQSVCARDADLSVNGRTVQALVEPRMHLGDFLQHCRLTGTHLGCEHGVCGACTSDRRRAGAHASLTRSPATVLPSGRSKDSTMTRPWQSCVKPFRVSTRCNAVSARPAC